MSRSRAVSHAVLAVAGRPNRGIVEGEEELGIQRRCSRCGEWWPEDEAFYHHNGHLVSGAVRWCSWCEACFLERRHGERAG